MAKILSQEEIQALFGAATMLDAGRRTSDSATSYNFRRPDRVSKETIRSLHFLHERFARNVSTSLSAYLRAATEVSIVSVEQFTYSEFLMSLPDPTAFYALTLLPVEGSGALELNPVVAFTMIDRMLGGSGQRVVLDRALTEIEQNVIDGVVKLILEQLSEAWLPIIAAQFRVTGRETRPQMLQVAAPNEAMLLLVFDIRVSDARGMLNLCIPTAGVEAIGSTFTQSWYRNRRMPSDHERDALLDNLGRVSVQVSAGLDTSLPARELLRLRRGEVLALGVPLTHPLTVRVGNMDHFEGHPMMVGEHAGIAISACPEPTRATMPVGLAQAGELQ
jgi:flagellar motor switch protein FliM